MASLDPPVKISLNVLGDMASLDPPVYWIQNIFEKCNLTLPNLRFGACSLGQLLIDLNIDCCSIVISGDQSEMDVQPFHSYIFLIVANMCLSKHSAPYWCNRPFLIFWHSGTLALTSERQSAWMSKNWKGSVRPVWHWTLWSVTICHVTGLERVNWAPLSSRDVTASCTHHR